MKKILGLIILFTLSAQAEDTFRTFTAQDGRTLKATVTDYNEAKGVVVIQREDGKKITVKPDAFSEKDQTHIKKWHSSPGIPFRNILQT